MFVDHASSKIFHQPQTDLTAASTIFGKQRVEAEAANLGISIKKYHSVNGVFALMSFENTVMAKIKSLTSVPLVPNIRMV